MPSWEVYQKIEDRAKLAIRKDIPKGFVPMAIGRFENQRELFEQLCEASTKDGRYDRYGNHFNPVDFNAMRAVMLCASPGTHFDIFFDARGVAIHPVQFCKGVTANISYMSKVLPRNVMDRIVSRVAGAAKNLTSSLAKIGMSAAIVNRALTDLNGKEWINDLVSSISPTEVEDAPKNSPALGTNEDLDDADPQPRAGNPSHASKHTTWEEWGERAKSARTKAKGLVSFRSFGCLFIAYLLLRTVANLATIQQHARFMSTLSSVTQEFIQMDSLRMAMAYASPDTQVHVSCHSGRDELVTDKMRANFIAKGAMYAIHFLRADGSLRQTRNEICAAIQAYPVAAHDRIRHSKLSLQPIHGVVDSLDTHLYKWTSFSNSFQPAAPTT